MASSKLAAPVISPAFYAVGIPRETHEAHFMAFQPSILAIVAESTPVMLTKYHGAGVGSTQADACILTPACSFAYDKTRRFRRGR